MKKAFNYLLIGSLVVCSCGTIWASVQTDIEQASKLLPPKGGSFESRLQAVLESRSPLPYHLDSFGDVAKQ
jgi:hypothetical protein